MEHDFSKKETVISAPSHWTSPSFSVAIAADCEVLVEVAVHRSTEQVIVNTVMILIDQICNIYI